MNIKTNKKLSVREATRRFGISPNTVCKCGKNIKPNGQRKQRVSKIDTKKLEEDVRNNPDAYQYKRAKLLEVSQIAGAFWIKKIRNNI